MSMSHQLINQHQELESPKVQQKNNNYLFAPQSLTEAMQYAKMIASSSFCPSQMKGKEGDILIAMQMGAEVGLSPLQALQNIAVINGKPCIWGDAALALVQVCSSYISHREWLEGSIEEGNLVAFCSVLRKNSEEYVKGFSQKDAERAGLWKKSGVWSSYPTRMLQMRARGFCLRDKFADALKGLSIREEVEDYQSKDLNKNNVRQLQVVKQPETKKIEPISDDVVNMILDDIDACKTTDELREVYLQATKSPALRANRDELNKIVLAKDNKKLSLESESKKIQDEFIEEYDSVTGEIKE